MSLREPRSSAMRHVIFIRRCAAARAHMRAPARIRRPHAPPRHALMFVVLLLLDAHGAICRRAARLSFDATFLAERARRAARFHRLMFVLFLCRAKARDEVRCSVRRMSARGVYYLPRDECHANIRVRSVLMPTRQRYRAKIRAALRQVIYVDDIRGRVLPWRADEI